MAAGGAASPPDEALVRRFAGVYAGPWGPADALVWAADPASTTPSGATPPAERLSALRQRLYRPGASARDVEAVTAAAAELAGLQREAVEAAVRAGIDLERLDEPTPDRSDAVVDREPAAPAPGRLTRRRVVFGAAAAGAAGVAAAVAWTLNRPPDLGPLVRSTATWRALAGAPSLSEAAIDEPDPTSRSVAVAFLPIPATLAERVMAPRSPFYGRGSSATDFDVRSFDVGVATVAVTAVCSGPTRLTVELGVLDGERQPVARTAFRIAGPVAARRAVAATTAVTPFERPRLLRVRTDPPVQYVVRAVFLGTTT